MVVVGAGIVGASVAHHAARRGAAVTLIDDRPRPAGGVTGSSFAWIGDSGRWPGGAAHLRAGALPHWHRLERDLPGVRVRWTGALCWPAGDPAGGDVVTAAEVAALEPNLRNPPDRAIRFPRDGALDPVAVTRALAGTAGVRVVPGVTAVRLRTTAAGRVTGVETTAGPVPADTVVLAAGTGTAGLCPALPVPASPAVLLRLTAPPGLVRAIVQGPDVEVRQAADGTLLVSASCSADPAPAELDRIAGRTTRALAATFHGAGDVEVTAVEVGRRPMPTDEAPVIGPVPGADGLYAAVMHSGVTLAPLVGDLVAGEVVDGRTAPELRDCRPARFHAA